MLSHLPLWQSDPGLIFSQDPKEKLKWVASVRELSSFSMRIVGSPEIPFPGSTGFIKHPDNSVSLNPWKDFHTILISKTKENGSYLIWHGEKGITVNGHLPPEAQSSRHGLSVSTPAHI